MALYKSAYYYYYYYYVVNGDVSMTCFLGRIIHSNILVFRTVICKGKGSPYSTTECRVPELIPVFGSQPAGDVSHKPGGRLPLLSARPAVILTTLKRAAANFVAW